MTNAADLATQNGDRNIIYNYFGNDSNIEELFLLLFMHLPNLPEDAPFWTTFPVAEIWNDW